MEMEQTGEADFEYEGLESGDLEPEEFYEASEGEDIEPDESEEEPDETVEAEYDLAPEEEPDETLEPDESSFEAAMETDEEAVETEDEEAVSPAVRVARARARRHRLMLARQQRAERMRALATQRSIARRIRAIPTAPRARTYSIGRLQGAGVVTAMLPNGRRTHMRLMPAPAPIAEVNKLRAIINVNAKRQAAAIATNTRAISGLAKAQAEAVKKLTGDQVKADRELAKRIAEGDTRLDKRITQELSSGKGGLGKQRKRIMRMLRRQRQRSLWNNILLTSAMPLFAAYGDRSNPLSRTNLMLTGSLAGWLLGDELLDQYMRAPGKAGRTTNTIANTWSYVAPFGNAATTYLLLKDRQHERFVTGFADTFEDGKEKTVEKFKVASGSFEEFKARTDVPVVATLVSGGDQTTTVAAKVKDGKLALTVSGEVKDARVAWMVDTRPEAS